MKTSNKLLITLVSLIFGITSAIFLDIRVFGSQRGENNPIKKTFNEALGDYKYLVVEGIGHLEIRPSEHNHLHFVLSNDTVNVGITYKIVNDTLVITDNPKVHSFNSYSLYTSSEIESILVKKATVQLSALSCDHLAIEVIDGKIEDSRLESNVKNLRLHEKTSNVQLSNTKVDNLSLNLESSKARFNKGLEKIDAVLKDQSELSVKNLSDIELKKDESSRLTVY